MSSKEDTRSSSSCTTANSPSSAAQCRAVSPFFDFTCFRISGFGFWVSDDSASSAAQCRAVSPFFDFTCFRVSGSSGFGFRVSSLGFGFRVSGLGFRVSGFGFRVSGSSAFGFRVSGFRFRVSGFGFRVSGFRFRNSGFGFRVSGSDVDVGAVVQQDSHHRFAPHPYRVEQRRPSWFRIPGFWVYEG